MSSFEVVGGLLAITAFVVAFLGIRSADFPGSPRAEKIVSAVFAVLVVAAVTTGVISASHEYEAREQAEKAAKSR